MDFEQLSIFRLSGGGHGSPEDGLCAMEAVAWLEGLKHSDQPPCTCPVIAAYVRALNDRLGDEDRQRLVAYLPRLVGTVSPEHEVERGQYLAWQAVTVFAPYALDKCGLTEHAGILRALPRHDWAAVDAATAGAMDAAAAYASAYTAAAYADAHAATSDAAAAYAAAVRADATSAAAAAYAATVRAADLALNALDGVLEIGKKSPGFSGDIKPRIRAYRELASVQG